MDSNGTTRGTNWGTAALWAAAMVLGALLLVQIGRASSAAGNVAKGDVVTRVGDYTALTFNGGTDDVMVVLDGRGEQVFAYRVKNQNTVELLERLKLADIFTTAQRMGAGGMKK